MGWRQVISPNLDDSKLYVYNGGQALVDWYGWCLAVARSAFGLPPRGATAWDCYVNYTQFKHEDRNFPVGVFFLIWFSGYGGAGHVAIAYIDPNTGVMTIWTSPYTHKAYFDHYSDVDKLARGYGVTYAGWSEDLAGARVIEWVPDAPPFTFSVDPIEKQVQVLPGHYRWDLDRANFDDIANNPIGDSPADPITVRGVLHRSDIPQYAYYVEDVNAHQGYNTLDCADYTPPAPEPAPNPEPAQPEPTEEQSNGPTQENQGDTGAQPTAPAEQDQPEAPTDQAPTLPTTGTQGEPGTGTTAAPVPPVGKAAAPAWLIWLKALWQAILEALKR